MPVHNATKKGTEIYPIYDNPDSRSARRRFATLLKPYRNHRFCVCVCVCVYVKKKILFGYGFNAGARAIRCTVDIGLNTSGAF